MGPDAMEIYRIKKKADNSDTLKEIQKFKTDHFVATKPFFSEIVKFRNAARRGGESVNDFVFRLRQLARQCNFDGLDKELERQFAVKCSKSA
jgi:hypothetical protein